jgi:hypothetical protein
VLAVGEAQREGVSGISKGKGEERHDVGAEAVSGGGDAEVVATKFWGRACLFPRRWCV